MTHRIRKSLEEQIASRCVHFTGVMNDTCEAGVAYAAVRDESKPGKDGLPCFRDGECIACEKRRFPTTEEVKAEIEEGRLAMERTFTAMAAAQADAKANGFKKGNGGVGSVKCPCCESGTLGYSVSGYNGHLWGKCSTEGCVAWMQ